MVVETSKRDLYLSTKIVTNESFSIHQGFGLVALDENKRPSLEIPTFRVLKRELYLNFKARVARHFEVAESRVRLWVFVKRLNNTIRPNTAIPEDDPDLTMGMVKSNLAGRSRRSNLLLYLEVVSISSRPPNLDLTILFLKLFDAANQTLLGVGKMKVREEQKISEIVPRINKMMHWPSGSSLILYEEIGPGMIQLMEPRLTFEENAMQNGDIVCFQIKLGRKEIYDLESRGLYSNPIQFYEHSLRNRVVTPSQPKDNTTPEGTEQCVICLKHNANFAVIECGHLCLCRKCSRIIMDSSRKCPICRGRVDRFLKIYKP